MNDLNLCLEVVSRSCQPLRYIQRWISRKPLEIKAWFKRATNRKWHMGYQMDMWPMTSRHPQTFCEAVRSAILAKAWLLVIFSKSFSIYFLLPMVDCYSSAHHKRNISMEPTTIFCTTSMRDRLLYEQWHSIWSIDLTTTAYVDSMKIVGIHDGALKKLDLSEMTFEQTFQF